MIALDMVAAAAAGQASLYGQRKLWIFCVKVDLLITKATPPCAITHNYIGLHVFKVIITVCTLMHSYL